VSARAGDNQADHRAQERADQRDMADALNPASSSERLRQLARHESPTIRARLVTNPSLPEDVRVALARDRVPMVRLEVAVSGHSSTEIIDELATDRLDPVRTKAARHPALSSQAALRLAAQDPHREVRTTALTQLSEQQVRDLIDQYALTASPVVGEGLRELVRRGVDMDSFLADQRGAVRSAVTQILTDSLTDQPPR